jgi:APA family basic amino acid/polyamine antiporter
MILLFTGIHLRGIKTGARMQNVLTLLKVAMIAGLVILGFTTGSGDMHHFFQGESLGTGFSGWKTAGLSLMWIMFAYSGWNASTYIGAEIHNPKRNLPYSLLLGTGIVMVLYISLNALYVYAIAPAEMKGVISVGGLAAEKLFGRDMETIFSLLIAFALFSSLSAFLIIGPRVYFSMAREGHFFKSLGRLSPSTHVPANAILLQALFSVIIVISGTFDQILTYMGFSLGIFPILAVAGVYKMRHTSGKTPRFAGYPITSGIYILSGTAMLLLSFLERPAESAIALATVLIGIPVYFLFRKQPLSVYNH